MKIRLMGSADLVRGWAALLEEQFGVVVGEYPNRRGGNEVRYYIDLDDRTAAEVMLQRGRATVEESDRPVLPGGALTRRICRE